MQNMELAALFLIFTLLVSVCGQSSQVLTIRIVNDDKDTLDTRMQLNLGHILYLTLCKAEGNQAVLRVNPLSSNMEIMDEHQGLTADTKGVTSCMFEEGGNNVTCKSGHHFCELNNECVAEIMSSCSPTNMRKMHYIDVTMVAAEKQLIVVNCLALCDDPGFRGDDMESEGTGLSDLAVGLIIAGVILVAALLVAGAVWCKLRDSELVRQKHHRSHHIEYAT